MADLSAGIGAPLLAAGSSLVYGSADFMGGLASKRTDGVVVTVRSQIWGLIPLAVGLVLWSGVEVAPGDLVWGVAAGVTAGLGLMLFYPALAAGPMSVVAPVTALCSAVVPLVAGIALGERPSTLALVGVALALPAIGLVARGDVDGDHHADRATVLKAAGAGVGFGFFFLALAQTSLDAGLWPLVGARVGSIGSLVVVMLVTRRSWRVAPESQVAVVLAGMLDVMANAMYLVAAGIGLLSIVAVLGSLYPVATVILARVVLGERIGRGQLVGIGLAAAALTLVALGR